MRWHHHFPAHRLWLLFFSFPAWTWSAARSARSSSHLTTIRTSSRSMWRATGKSAPCAASSFPWTATRRCSRTTCSLTSMATRTTLTREGPTSCHQWNNVSALFSACIGVRIRSLGLYRLQLCYLQHEWLTFCQFDSVHMAELLNLFANPNVIL